MLDADPDPDQDKHRNYADPHADPTLSFTNAEIRKKTTFYHSFVSLHNYIV